MPNRSIKQQYLTGVDDFDNDDNDDDEWMNYEYIIFVPISLLEFKLQLTIVYNFNIK